MSELKSAWEIAQEKANKLGKLSLQEMRQQREQECGQIGRAIAQKYLDEPEPPNLATELNNYPVEERGLIERAILNHLAQAMDLKSWSGTSPDPTKYNNRSGGVYPRLEKIIRGIVAINPNSQPVIEQIKELDQEYGQAVSKTRQAIKNRGRETLHQLRISGAAVDSINIEATQEWQQSWHKLTEPFTPRLGSLKQELIKASCIISSPLKGED